MPYPRVTLCALLLAQAACLTWTAARAGTTVDEQGHMVGGLFSWRFGRFDLYRVNPPLTELLATAPVALAGYEEDWSGYDGRPGERPQWRMGEDWLAANGPRGLRLFFLARLALIPVVVLGGWGCFLWARDLYGGGRRAGDAAGLLACGLWCFNPSLLTHGALITPDAAAASAGVWAGYAFWRFLKSSTAPAALFAGTLLGAANLAKTTWVILFALWPALWLLRRIADRRGGAGSAAGCAARPAVRSAGALALLLGTGLYVLNAGYGFEGTFTPLGEVPFVSTTLAGPRAGEPGSIRDADGAGNRFAGTPPAGLPVPVPANWLRGADVQRRDFEVPHRSYLFGEWRAGGWPHYYLAAFAVKEPLGLFALLALATAAWRTGAGATRARDGAVLLAPPLAVLALVSSQTNMSHHPRYLLPAYGFLFVWCGRAVRLATAGGPGAFGARARRRWAVAVGAAALAYAAEGVRGLPYPHAFVNAAAGGPANGWRLLHNSGIDWGQGDAALAEWQRGRPDRPLDGVALFGRARPVVYGLPAAEPPPKPRPGVWAISAGSAG